MGVYLHNKDILYIMREHNFNNYIKILKKYYWNNWIIPTFDVMRDFIGLKSNNSITRFYQKASELWFLNKDWSKYFPTEKLTSSPLYWNISCWIADEIESNIVNYIDLNKYIIWWNPDWIVLVEAKWESMIDVWIFEWDIVSVDLNNNYPHNWDLVIATIDWDKNFTLKEYWKDKSWNSYLKYRNEWQYPWKIIEADSEIKIIWVVKWLVRKF